jgi:hypothetical protein
MAGVMNMILGEPRGEDILANLASIYTTGLLRKNIST